MTDVSKTDLKGAFAMHDSARCILIDTIETMLIDGMSLREIALIGGREPAELLAEIYKMRSRALRPPACGSADQKAKKAPAP